MADDYLVVMVTVGDEARALALGRLVVEERLAACAQLLPPGTAVYRWEGAVHAEPQCQLLLKTRQAAWPALRDRILEAHDDQVPEILALPVADGLPAYLAWVTEMTGGPAVAAGWQPYEEAYGGRSNTVSGTVMVRREVWSPQLRNARDLLVYLPPSYDGLLRRYPVIYMHDGQNLFDEVTSYAGEWHADEVMEALASEEIEAIVVGVPNAGERRMAEYGPFPDKDLPDPQAGEYLRFLAETVKPEIDRSFRTLPGRKHTAVIGSSMGGLVSLYAFFSMPEVFGLCGAMSPALLVGRRAMAPWVMAAPSPPGRIYVDVGTREGVGLVRKRDRQRKLSQRYLDEVRSLVDGLRAKGYADGASLWYAEDRGAVHHESAWAARLPDALRYLLGRQGE
jgi:predicted alpha/beta superfamily hydrolase/uncharacterized protein involved in tolerance to divalent cations